MDAFLLMPQVSEQAQAPRHGCQKSLNPSKWIVVPSSGAEEGTTSLQSSKHNLTFLLLSKRTPSKRKSGFNLGERQSYTQTGKKSKGSTGTWWECWDVTRIARKASNSLLSYPFSKPRVACSFLTLFSLLTWMAITVQFAEKKDWKLKPSTYLMLPPDVI